MEVSQDVCMDITENGELDNSYEAQIQEFLQIRGIALVDLLGPEWLETRKEFILWLKENTGISGRKLAEVTGMNRATIRKIIINKQPTS